MISRGTLSIKGLTLLHLEGTQGLTTLSITHVIERYLRIHNYEKWLLKPWLHFYLTLPMLRLHSSKAQKCKYFWKPYKPCHGGIYEKALAEYSQMSTHLPGFQSFFSFFLHHCVLAKLATSSIRVKILLCYQDMVGQIFLPFAITELIMIHTMNTPLILHIRPACKMVS